MCDTFRPLKLADFSRSLDNPDYMFSWYRGDRRKPPGARNDCLRETPDARRQTRARRSDARRQTLNRGNVSAVEIRLRPDLEIGLASRPRRGASNLFGRSLRFPHASRDGRAGPDGSQSGSAAHDGGHECVVFDLDPAAVEALTSEGAVGAASIEELVSAARGSPRPCGS